MATHQCVRFNSDPKLVPESTTKRISHYLLDTKYKALIFRPDNSQGLKCYVGADFAGAWKDDDHESVESVLPRICNHACWLPNYLVE